jgi:hypothetical protein
MKARQKDDAYKVAARHNVDLKTLPVLAIGFFADLNQF